MKISVRDKDNDLLKPLEIITLKGEDGITPNIQIGTVTTVDSDQEASVVKRGTKEEPIFDFNIPRGTSGGSVSDSVSIDDTSISKDKTWSSSKIEDFTLTNVGAIWKEINGEVMVIDNAMEGCLREVEIWGNTIQNEDNLSDIQHLGVWNEEKQGYEIEIKVTNRNLINPKQTYQDNSVFNNEGKISTMKGYAVLNERILVKPNNRYYIKNANHVATFNNKGNFIKKLALWGGNGKPVQFTTPENTASLQLQINWSDFSNRDLSTLQFSDSGNENSFIKHESFSIVLLLPCQLMKVGNIADRLYWDKSKGRYIIEKNIDIKEINKTNLPKIYFLEPNRTEGFTVFPMLARDLNINCKTADILCNKFKNIKSAYSLKTGGEWITAHAVYIILQISNNDLDSLDRDGLIEWFDDNIIKIYYVNNTPQLIDTDIREELKLPTFINNTYITVNGGIQGSIKAKAPVDGGKVIGVLQEENKDLKSLVDTTMLATDEILTILEPLLVDLLSNNSSSKIIDMYVAMVKSKRGLKTIDEVPLRYREQVKEIIGKEGEM